MPALISSESVQHFDHAIDIPADVLNILRSNAPRANVILPHIEKLLGIQEFKPRIVSNEQLWLVYTKPGTSSIKFVLSCTEVQMGKYPIFIVPTVPISELTPELLGDSMEAFCHALLRKPGFKKNRVFSVFSVDLVAEAFAEAWERLAEIDRMEELYYDAIFTLCSRDTFVAAPAPEDVVMRPAAERDAQKSAVLCEEFAATSPPFLLSPEKAAEEAYLLIMNKQLWILEMRNDNGEFEIATIVAVTRKSKGVAAITKVYTPEKWRGKRLAEKLVRHVCKELLQTYEKIVLYVGVDNAAKKVYGRVGFPGLIAGSPSSDEVEHWIEIGFDQTKVVLGHW